jgi:hypothetical protein
MEKREEVPIDCGKIAPFFKKVTYSLGVRWKLSNNESIKK